MWLCGPERHGEERIVRVGAPAHEGEAALGLERAPNVGEGRGAAGRRTSRRSAEKTRSIEPGSKASTGGIRQSQVDGLHLPRSDAFRAPHPASPRRCRCRARGLSSRPTGARASTLAPQPQPTSSTCSPSCGEAASIATAVTSVNRMSSCSCRRAQRRPTSPFPIVDLAGIAFGGGHGRRSGIDILGEASAVRGSASHPRVSRKVLSGIFDNDGVAHQRSSFRRACFMMPTQVPWCDVIGELARNRYAARLRRRACTAYAIFGLRTASSRRVSTSSIAWRTVTTKAGLHQWSTPAPPRTAPRDALVAIDA